MLAMFILKIYICPCFMMEMKVRTGKNSLHNSVYKTSTPFLSLPHNESSDELPE